MASILSLLQRNRPSFTSNIEDVIRYVRASKIIVQKGTKCVDGRYLPSQAHGMLARPGADGGYVMALEAVNRKKNLRLTPTQCFNAVFNAVKKLNGTFYLHTDDHTDPDPHTHHGLIGCGHLAKAGRRFFSWEYDIRSRDVKEIVNYARYLCEISPHISMVNLTGSHEERGVLIIKSKKYTVLTDNPKRHEMYFVYDVDRDRDFMRKLVDLMNIDGLILKDMINEADLQLDATLRNLAVGLPVFEITFSDKKPQVSYIKHIKPKTFLGHMHLPPRSYFQPYHT